MYVRNLLNANLPNEAEADDAMYQRISTVQPYRTLVKQQEALEQLLQRTNHIEEPDLDTISLKNGIAVNHTDLGQDHAENDGGDR